MLLELTYLWQHTFLSNEYYIQLCIIASSLFEIVAIAKPIATILYRNTNSSIQFSPAVLRLIDNWMAGYALGFIEKSVLQNTLLHCDEN